jgi:HK97 family phage prohead protease
MKSSPDFERMIFPAEFKFIDGVVRASEAAADSLVEGYANVFGNLDHNGDIVRPGAFRKTIQERVARGLVPLLDSHQWDAAHTIGTVTEAHEDQKGLRFRARMSKAPSAQEVRQKMLEGHIKRLSIGFAPVRESYERVDQAPVSDDSASPAIRRKSIVRHLHEVKLFEISAVPIAANEQAMITNIKAAVPFQDLPLAGREVPWDSEQARKRIAEWAGAGQDESTINWARYRRAFLWYERARADETGGYKLPIADVVDGELSVVPRAIFAAAGALQGARGGVDLAGDEEAVKANVERYYLKMAREFQDESLVAPWRRKSLDLMVLEARALGCCDPGDIELAASELLGLLGSEDRARLLERLSASPPSAAPGLDRSGSAVRADALAIVRRRAALIGSEICRRRAE